MASEMITAIGQLAIHAKDVARASRFYRDVLGVRHLFDAGPTMSFFDVGGVRLMLSTAESSEFDRPASVVYYKVGDIQAAYTTLAERGATAIDAPHLVAKLPDHELWMVFFRDSEENVFALMSEVRS